MHSKIYQIAEERIDNENFITERTFDDGSYDFYDYCADITDDERNYAIDFLARNLLPTGMFILDENEKNTLIYNGGADEWKEDWVKRIHQKIKAITAENVTEWIARLIHWRRNL